MARERNLNWLFNKTQSTRVMGVLNVTPDSFSDGNQFMDPEFAKAHALEMSGAGADIIDIGGESTRPGSNPVSAEVELERVIPVIVSIRKVSDIPISIDTTKSIVAEKALGAGADWINDISGLTFDKKMAKTAVKFSAPVVIMHMQGKPVDMQKKVEYSDLIGEIKTFFKTRIAYAVENGIREDRIILDPGIGFGKTVDDNFTIIRNLGEIKMLGYPVLIGVSRKSFIGKILDKDVRQRLMGTAAAVAGSIIFGADIIRVHDVEEMKQVAMVAERIRCDS